MKRLAVVCSAGAATAVVCGGALATPTVAQFIDDQHSKLLTRRIQGTGKVVANVRQLNGLQLLYHPAGLSADFVEKRFFEVLADPSVGEYNGQPEESNSVYTIIPVSAHTVEEAINDISGKMEPTTLEEIVLKVARLSWTITELLYTPSHVRSRQKNVLNQALVTDDSNDTNEVNRTTVLWLKEPMDLASRDPSHEHVHWLEWIADHLQNNNNSAHLLCTTASPLFLFEFLQKAELIDKELLHKLAHNTVTEYAIGYPTHIQAMEEVMRITKGKAHETEGKEKETEAAEGDDNTITDEAAAEIAWISQGTEQLIRMLIASGQDEDGTTTVAEAISNRRTKLEKLLDGHQDVDNSVLSAAEQVVYFDVLRYLLAPNITTQPMAASSTAKLQAPIDELVDHCAGCEKEVSALIRKGFLQLVPVNGGILACTHQMVQPTIFASSEIVATIPQVEASAFAEWMNSPNDVYTQLQLRSNYMHIQNEMKEIDARRAELSHQYEQILKGRQWMIEQFDWNGPELNADTLQALRLAQIDQLTFEQHVVTVAKALRDSSDSANHSWIRTLKELAKLDQAEWRRQYEEGSVPQLAGYITTELLNFGTPEEILEYIDRLHIRNFNDEDSIENFLIREAAAGVLGSPMEEIWNYVSPH